MKYTHSDMVRFALCLLAVAAFQTMLPSLVYAAGAPPAAKTLGDMTNKMYDSFVSLQTFLSVLSYVLGTFFSITGLQMLRNYVDDPSRNPGHAALLRMGAAGFFLFAPSAASMLVATISGGSIGDTSMLVTANESGSTVIGTAASGTGLEQAVKRFVIDIASPMLDNILPILAYVGGLVFMMIGLKRLALANGDGPQAPGGMGTMGTFMVAACLLSFGYVMYVLQGSIFGVTNLYANSKLTSTGLTPQMADHANQTLWAVFIFLRVVGYISVLRGLFMLRAVAEGGNVSMVGVMTHLIAGAMLANGGMLVQTIQCTFVPTSQFAFSTISGQGIGC